MAVDQSPGTADTEELPEDTALASVQSVLADEGFDGQFIAAAEARVLCTGCRSLLAAAWLRADELTRLEGASDPDDMLVVIPLICPVCWQRGTLTMNFGPQVQIEDAAVFSAMHRQPLEGHDGGEPTPGITPGPAV